MLVVGKLTETYDLPVFRYRRGEPFGNGLPVPEDFSLHDASHRLVLVNVSWRVPETDPPKRIRRIIHSQTRARRTSEGNLLRFPRLRFGLVCLICPGLRLWLLEEVRADNRMAGRRALIEGCDPPHDELLLRGR